MWLILLDHSGSMGDPFSGKVEFAGRTRESHAAIKLEAAKEALLEHLQGLGTPSRVALIEFTSTASIVFDGQSDDRAGIQQVLDALEPVNGTDIAAALDKAAEYVGGVKDALTMRVLVVSDGLSDLESAKAAAGRLAAQKAVIDVILIDPTTDGEAIARAIAVSGSVSAVTSAKELAGEIKAARVQELTQEKQALAFLEGYAKEAKAVVEQTQPAEKLSFAAGYPGAVSPETWYPLLVYLHVARLQDEVQEMLRQRAAQLGLRPSLTTAESVSPLRRGTVLTLKPQLAGVIFNPAQQEVTWYEDVQEVGFRMQAQAEAAGRVVSGAIEVCVGQALIGLLPLAVNVRQVGAPEEEPEAATSTSQVFGRIFASYSHQNAQIVDACVAVYRALGIYVFIDKDSLRSGQQWARVLHQLIDRADLFQLYWSDTASKSDYVEDEWRYALSLLGRKGELFIRPLFWEEPMPRPPQDLSHLHFARLDVGQLSGSSGPAISPPVVSPPAPAAPSGPLSFYGAILPLLPGASPEAVAAAREDVNQAVVFLEETTGLRYYPVPTMLVDEHLIKAVRTFETTDLPPADDTLGSQALAWADILQSICLEFHVASLHPGNLDYNSFPGQFGRGRLLTEPQFDAVKGLCEGAVRGCTREYIQPPWQVAMASFHAKLPEIYPEEGFAAFVLRFLDDVLLMLQEAGRFRSQRESITIYHGREAGRLLQSDLEAAGIEATKGEFSEADLVLQGPFSALVKVIEHLRASLAQALPQYDRSDHTQAADPDEAGQSCLAMATVIDAICRNLIDWRDGLFDNFKKRGIATGKGLSPEQCRLLIEHSQDFDSWIQTVIQPQWRQFRNELMALQLGKVGPDLNFPDFMATFLDTVEGLLQEGLKNLGDFLFQSEYSIKLSSWELLETEIPDLKLHIASRAQSWQKEELVKPSGPFSGFLEVFQISAQRLVEILRRLIQTSSPLWQFFSVDVSTYGVYMPPTSLSGDRELAQWGQDQGVPVHLILAQTPRVLLCLGARQRFAEHLESISAANSAELAEFFQRCVVIHEHCHALLETGVGQDRSLGAWPQFQEAWRAAANLNESLAVWMELHFARENRDLKDLVLSYIRSGSYPDWPYRGAERVEVLYQARGIEGVRGLIQALRRDPESAQRSFDADLR